MSQPIRHPAVNRHIDALETIERLADLGCRGADPVAALHRIREMALVGLGRPVFVPPPPPRRLRVRVTTASHDLAWYAGSIGSEFEVVECGRDYVLAADYDRGYEAAWAHIEKCDAEVVP